MFGAKDPRHRLGRRGERIARRALRRAGLRVLGADVETPEGQVDLVCEEGGVLVVVEVKTVSREGEREPWPDRTQRTRLRRSAEALRRRARLARCRCDVVTVLRAQGRVVVRHHRGAF